MNKKSFSRIRLILLTLFIVFITFEAYQHQVKGGGPDGSPSIHALCPFGGLESLFTLFTSGTYIEKIYSGTLVLFVLSVLTALFFRRGFCGWLCPFGGIQELLGRFGQKVLGKQLELPAAPDKVLRYLKYPVLALTVFYSWKTASMWISPYDPWAAYGHLSEGIPAVWNEFSIGLIILVITLLGSFFYDRFFCKYLCPMGGFLGIISKISFFRIKRDKNLCIDCNLCTKSCAMKIDVAKVDTVSSLECINCQECVAVCPKEGALKNSFAGKGMIKPLAVGALILALYGGGVGIAKLADVYNLLPGPVTEGTVITDTEGLKGYMTLSEIASLTGLSLEEVYKLMEIPENIPSDTTAKELGGLVSGFDFHSAKEKLLQ